MHSNGCVLMVSYEYSNEMKIEVSYTYRQSAVVTNIKALVQLQRCQELLSAQISHGHTSNLAAETLADILT